MQLSYERHLRTALRPGRAVVDSPHRIALYGALASRYRTRGISPLEPELWAELAPFVSMTPDALAVQALAEYVVYQELPDDARQEWLRRVVEQEIATTRGEVRDPFLAGRRLNVAWQRLIAEPASRTPASAVASSGESAADDGRIDHPPSSPLVRTEDPTDVLLPRARGEEPIDEETDLDALAAAGDAGAQYALGVSWEHGPAWVENDCVEAVKWFRLAAEQGHARAQASLGEMYRSGRGVPKDDGEAARWDRLAANQGLPEAQFNLGFMYFTGRGVRQDDEEADAWCRRAAEQGLARAQDRLGSVYATGRGVPQDDAEAVRWYRLAADQGSVEAQSNLAAAYATGRGVPQDDAEAVRWYRLAADQGSVEAQSNLAAAYFTGRGVRQNDEKAAAWCRRAAEQGLAEAQERLAELYHNGRGVPQDEAEASRWCRLAADQGDTPAQYNFGLRCLKGQGVPQDSVAAHMWFNLAASRSTGDIRYRAVKNRDRAAQQLTADEIAEAQRCAREWDAEHAREAQTLRNTRRY